jgi:hypothetical protein
MQWTVRLSETALKTLEKINKPEQLTICNSLRRSNVPVGVTNRDQLWIQAFQPSELFINE